MAFSNIKTRITYNRDYRGKNPNYARNYKKKRYERIREIYYNGTECTLCGSTKRIVFHHPDPKDKKWNFARMAGYTDDKIKEEFDKCVPLCSSCHCRLHHV